MHTTDDSVLERFISDEAERTGLMTRRWGTRGTEAVDGLLSRVGVVVEDATTAQVAKLARRCVATALGA